jgi:hypothetical protein
MKLQREQLIDLMLRKKYAVFTKGNFNVNLVGIRANESQSNAFDDRIALFYKDSGQWQFHLFPATTDPGRFWLENLMNAGGSAVMVEGQYRGLWQIGWHQPGVAGLVQVRNVKIYRDRNRDRLIDRDPKTITEGLYGINLHAAWLLDVANEVGNWSAGCQVTQYRRDFDLILSVCRRSAQTFGNSFSYTLLHESDF